MPLRLVVFCGHNKKIIGLRHSCITWRLGRWR